MRTFLVEKEWDKELGSQVREKRVCIGYNTIERAKQFVETMNLECGNCPRRAALHTKYSILPNPINVRIMDTGTAPPIAK